jgi:translation elongation factor EF-Tu-like GTPase
MLRLRGALTGHGWSHAYVPRRFGWQLPDGIEMVMPGDNARVAVSLDKPVALDIGSHFAIREGGKTVGSGVITEVVE